MLYLVWIAVIVLSVVIEAATVSLVSIWFIPAAFVSMILSFCKVELWIQVVVFVVLSAILLIVAKTVFKNKINPKAVHTNADAVIGGTAVVTEAIDNNLEKGAVKIQGKEWTARSMNGDPIEVGALVEVCEIKGVKLICKTK